MELCAEQLQREAETARRAGAGLVGGLAIQCGLGESRKVRERVVVTLMRGRRHALLRTEDRRCTARPGQRIVDVRHDRDPAFRDARIER